jgi:flagellar motor switch protein FliG
MLEKKINFLSKKISGFNQDGWTWTLSKKLMKIKVISPSKKEYTLDDFQGKIKKYTHEDMDAKKYLEAIQEKEYLFQLQRKDSMHEHMLNLDEKYYILVTYSTN